MYGVILLVVSYVCLVIFVAKVVEVWRMYARMPVHLRWDLHPTPRDEASRGGSERAGEAKTLLAELRYMAREGLLFQQCFRANRSLWYATYPFHLGLFLSVFWVFLLFARVPFHAGPSWLLSLLDQLIIVSGAGGLILGVAGCVGLIVERILDSRLRVYTTGREYVNLSLILFALAFGLVTWIGSDSDFSLCRSYVQSLVTLSAPPPGDWLFSAGIILLSVFIAFLPFSSLQHGIAKFFSYHRVRWDDERNVRGGRLEKELQDQLNWPVTWSAPHVNCTRWADVADRKDGKEGGR